MSKSYNGFIFEDKKPGSDYLIVIQVEEDRYVGIYAACPKHDAPFYYSNAQFVTFPNDMQNLVASIEVKEMDLMYLIFESDYFLKSFTYPDRLGALEKALAQNSPNASSAPVKAAVSGIHHQYYSACDKLFARPLSDLRGLTLSQYNQK